MKFTLLYSFVLLSLFGCQKPVETILETVECETPIIIDTCQCLNGAWYLEKETIGKLFPDGHIVEGLNVWNFNNLDSTIVVINETDIGLSSGNYEFSLEEQNIIHFQDSANNIVLSPGYYYIEIGNMYIEFPEEILYAFKRE